MIEALGDVAGRVLAGVEAKRRGVEVYRPASREEWLAGRMKTVGASQVPALFGCHPHLTAFELFAEKRGEYKREFAETKIEENSIHLPPNERGTSDEPVAVELIRLLRPTWTLRLNQIPGGEVFIDRETRMSSTPDLFADDPAGESASIQVKSVGSMLFAKEWRNRDTGEIDAPMHAVIQAIIDADLSGRQRAFVAPVTTNFGRDLYLIEVPLHAKILAKARALVKEFFERVERNDPYPADFARDGAVIAALYADDNGSTIDLGDDARARELLDRREALKARESDGSAAEKERKIIDAEIIAKLGNATGARLADGRMISAPTTRRKGYAVEPSSYRAVKVKS
jgi:hypothetical protein